MKKTKNCIVCSKEMPKGMNNVCSPVCQKKREKELKKAKEEKVKVKKEKLFNTLSIQIKWIDDEGKRWDLRRLIEDLFIPFLEKKQIVVKVKRRKLKTKKMSLKDKLDAIFSLYIRARDKKCYCWNEQTLQNWHYFSRNTTSTRFDERNCNTCCSSCNVIHEHDREPYTKFMLKKYWPDIIEELRQKYHWPSLILKEQDYRILIEVYTNKLKELQW